MTRVEMIMIIPKPIRFVIGLLMVFFIGLPFYVVYVLFIPLIALVRYTKDMYDFFD